MQTHQSNMTLATIETMTWWLAPGVKTINLQQSFPKMLINGKEIFLKLYIFCGGKLINYEQILSISWNFHSKCLYTEKNRLTHYDSL